MKNVTSIIYTHVVTFIVWHVHEANDGFSNGHIFFIYVVNSISITQNLKLVQKWIYYEFVFGITWSLLATKTKYFSMLFFKMFIFSSESYWNDSVTICVYFIKIYNHVHGTNIKQWKGSKHLLVLWYSSLWKYEYMTKLYWALTRWRCICEHHW